METPLQQESVVRHHVDGVEFDLEISRLVEKGQRHHRALAASGEVYEPVMTRCLTRLLKSMDEPRFMDIGAFAGYFACYVATLLHDSHPVCAVESDPAYCEGIRRSAELNGLRNLRVYEAILSNLEEPVDLGADGWSVVFGVAEGEAGRRSVTLDGLCERESIPAPNIMKMDIHGSEGKALLGMRSILGRMDYLLLELHNHLRLEEFSPGVNRQDIMEHLWGLGLSIHFIAGHKAAGRMKERESIRSGRFAYRRVTRENADCLFFDRQNDAILLVSPRDDVEATLGASLDDPFLV